MSELKSCHSCGEDAAFVNTNSSIFAGQDYGDRYPEGVRRQPNGYQVRCDNCGLQTCWWYYEQEAINSWNTRAPQPTIDMVLYCPNCGRQHIDESESNCDYAIRLNHLTPDKFRDQWCNGPHRSHLCHDCGCIWRPADVATNGVADIKTEGKTDTWVTHPEVTAQPAISAQAIFDHIKHGDADHRKWLLEKLNEICAQPAAVPSAPVAWGKIYKNIQGSDIEALRFQPDEPLGDNWIPLYAAPHSETTK